MGKEKKEKPATSHVRKLFSENMRSYRKKQGYSQEKLAELINVSTQTINDI
jgi:DNA-binding XRE family transcriptional regulator